MKFIALISILFSVASMASTPLNVCLEEFKRTGDKAAFEFCMSQDNQPAALSIPRNLCKKFLPNVTAYNSCMNGDYDKPMSIPRDLCEEFGYGTVAYDACMNGELDKPMSIPRHLCEEFGYGTVAYDACMNGELDKPMNLIDDCEKYADLPESAKPLECQYDEMGMPMI